MKIYSSELNGLRSPTRSYNYFDNFHGCNLMKFNGTLSVYMNHIHTVLGESSYKPDRLADMSWRPKYNLWPAPPQSSLKLVKIMKIGEITMFKPF